MASAETRWQGIEEGRSTDLRGSHVLLQVHRLVLLRVLRQGAQHLRQRHIQAGRVVSGWQPTSRGKVAEEVATMVVEE